MESLESKARINFKQWRCNVKQNDLGESFNCTKCGACCQNIAHIAELRDCDKGNGVCKHLDLDTNECKIYANRPTICRVDTMFEKYFSSIYSKGAFYRLNAECCNILQEKLGIDESFRMKI